MADIVLAIEGNQSQTLRSVCNMVNIDYIIMNS